MESACGAQWAKKFASADEYTFSFFRVQKFSKAQYVTVEITVENEYGSTTVVPASEDDTIVRKSKAKSRAEIQNCPVEKLSLLYRCKST